MRSALLGFGNEFLISPAAIIKKAIKHLLCLIGSASLHVATVSNPLSMLGTAQTVELFGRVGTDGFQRSELNLVWVSSHEPVP